MISGVVALLLVALILRLEAFCPEQIRLIEHQLREFGAQGIDAAFQIIVEHVGHHGHATTHPLAGAAEFGVVELRHAGVAMDDGPEHADDRIRAEAMALGNVVDGLMACS